MHGNKFNYDKVEFNRLKEKVTIVCPVHGDFKQNGASHLKGYGCKKCATSHTKDSVEDFIQKAKAVHGDHYDYSKVVYTSSREPVEIVCPVHGGFLQRPNNHLSGQQCNKCSRGCGLSFIEDAKKVHGDKYDYSRVRYQSAKEKVEIVCPNHGVFTQTPAHHREGHACPSCSGSKSKFEYEVLSFIENDLCTKTITRCRSVIGPKEVDIFIPSSNLCIELNGNYWHSELHKKPNYHKQKTDACEAVGKRLIHVFHYNWYNRRYAIKNLLRAKLNVFDKKIGARECSVRTYDAHEIKYFCDIGHVQGHTTRSKFCVGLEFKGSIVGVMTFGKPRFRKDAEWELLRLCFKPGVCVVGGASRMLKKFEKTVKPKSLISYAKRDWSSGGVYHTLGFELVEKTKPGYVWWKHNTQTIIPRYKTQKHKLEAFLGSDVFDAKKSEIQNMKNANYFRIFDSGNLSFRKEYK